MNKTFNTIIETNKIGIIIYGSLFKNEGILSQYLDYKYYDGPKLKISFTGCNIINQNLTRVIDYKNGKYTKTFIKIFNEILSIEQIIRYVTLREGNINYVTYYKSITDEIINLPGHLLEFTDLIKNDIKLICEKLKLDYLIFITYPSKITNIIKYVNKSDNILNNSKKYLNMCCEKSLSSLEKKILFNFM